MAKDFNRVASLANICAYDAYETTDTLDGSPHIKHASLRTLYAELVLQVYEQAKRFTDEPRILDLGAGEGSVTLPFLELGGIVTAVDISRKQLDNLANRCARFGARLECRCEDANQAISNVGRDYDIVVMNSFLHHVPDYLSLLADCTKLLSPFGQIFSFQDPLRYDSLRRFTRIFSGCAYFSWRVMKADVLGGLSRRLRRARGIYLQESVHDNAEYHVTRNGVDQEAIARVLEAAGLETTVIPYFSTQSRIFQPLGAALRLANSFAVVAQKLPHEKKSVSCCGT